MILDGKWRCLAYFITQNRSMNNQFKDNGVWTSISCKT